MQSIRASTAMALVLGIYAAFNSVAANGQATTVGRTPPIVAADPKTRISVAPNGTPIVNIALPRTDGTSYNVFSKFDVGREGAVFNNSPTIGTSVLGGKILPNPALVRGNASANLILAEVLGGTRSSLRGPMEVFGPSAALVIANPSGITCDGCGFINISRATLSTGKIVFGADGSFTGLHVDGGDISVEGQGLLAGNVDFFDIISAATNVSANIYARDLVLSGGLAEYDYARRATTGVAGGEVLFAVDSSLLGGMYANRILLIGNGNGVGVNLQGLVNALDGPLTITAEGTIAAQSVASSQQVEIRSTAGDVTIGQQLYAGDSLLISAGGSILQSGDLIGAAHNVKLAANGDVLLGGSGLYAGLDTDGKLTQLGTLTISAGDAIRGIGVRAVATGDIQMAARGAFFDATSAVSAGNVTLRISQDLMSSGRVEGTNDVALDAKTIKLSGDVIANGLLDIQAQDVSVDGRAAGLTQLAIRAANVIATTEAADLQSKGHIDISSQSLNNAGRLLAEKDISIQAVGSLDSTGDILSGADVALTGNTVALGGDISSNGAIRIMATSHATIDGRIAAVGLLSVGSGALDLSGTLSSHGKLGLTSADSIRFGDSAFVVSDDDVDVTAMSLAARGAISSKKSLTISVSGAADLSGTVVAGDRISVAALQGSFDGSIVSNGTITIDTAGDQRIGGILSALDSIDITSKAGVLGLSAAQIVASNSIAVISEQEFENSGAISSNRVSLVTGGNWSNGGTILAADILSIRAGNTVTQSGLAQSANSFDLIGDTIDLRGTTVGGKTVVLSAHNVNSSTTSDIESGGMLSIAGDDSVNLAGKIIAVEDLSVTSRGNISLAANIASAKSVGITTAGILAQNGAISSIGQINLIAEEISGFGTLGTDDAVIMTAGAGGIDLAGQASAKTSLSLATAGRIKLRGKFATDGAMRVAASTLIVDDDIAAGGGVILAVPGDLTIDRLGAIRSGMPITFSVANFRNSGTVAALGDLAIRADTVNNDGQILSSQSLTLISGGDFKSTGLVSAGGIISIGAVDLINSGTIESADSIGMAFAQGSVGGTVASNGNIALASGSGSFALDGNLAGKDITLTSSGGGLFVALPATIAATGQAQLIAATDLTLDGAVQTNGGIKLVAGTDLTIGAGSSVVTKGALNASASGAIVNSATLVSAGALSITGDDIRSGSLASDQDINLSATRKITVDGEVGTASSISLSGTAASFDILASGSLAAGQDLTLDAGQSISNAGALSADRNATLRAATQITNTGQIAARTGVAKLVATNLDVGGSLFAKNSLALTSDDISISGIVGSDGSSDIATRILNVSSGGIFQSNNNLKISFSDAQIGGIVSALDSLMLDGGSATISSSGAIASKGDQVTQISGALSNIGSITSNGKLNLSASQINNAGAIAATADLLVNTLNITNFGQLGSSAGIRIVANILNNRASGSIQAANALSFDTDKLVNEGDVEATGPITATARTSFASSGTLRSNSAINVMSNGAVSLGGKLDGGSTFDVIAGSLALPGEVTLSRNISLRTTIGDIEVNGKAISGASISAIAHGILRVSEPALLYGMSGLSAGGDSVSIRGQLASPEAVSINAVSSIDLPGVVVSNKTVDLRSRDQIAITGGGVVNAGSVVLATASLSVSGNVTSGGASSFDVSGATVISGNLLAKSGVNISGGGDFAVNTGGNLISEQAIDWNNIGTLTVAGTVAANGDVEGHLDGPANVSGTLQSGANVTLSMSGANALDISGQITAAHDVAFAGGVASVSGAVVAGNQFSLSTDRFLPNLISLKVDGTIAAVGSANVTTAGGIAIGQGGSLFTTNGDLNVSSGYINVAGVLASGGALIYATRHDLDGTPALPANEVTVSGAVQALRSLTLGASRGVSLLSGGTFISNDRVVIRGQGISLGGRASATNLISVAAANDIALGGTLQTADRIAMIAGGDIILRSGSRVETVGNGRSIGLVPGAGAAANIDLQATGSLSNLGTIFTDGSAAIYSDSGNISIGGNITVQRDVVLESRLGGIDTAGGVISASNIGVIQNATDFANSGTLVTPGNLLVSARGIVNSGLLGSNGSLQLIAGSSGFQNFSGGTIFSSSGISIASGIGAPSGTAAFRNTNASIIAIGDINITANDVFNSSGLIESLAGNISIQANNLTNQIANLVIASDAFQDIVTSSSGPAQISAAMDLAITALGVVTNSNSSISAGGDITITADTVNNIATQLRQSGGGTTSLPTSIFANGLVTINANLFNNGAITPSGTFNGTGASLPSVMIVPASQAGGRGSYSSAGNPTTGTLPGSGTPGSAGNGGNPLNASLGGVSIQSGGALSTGASSANGAGFLGTVTPSSVGPSTAPVGPANGGPSAVTTGAEAPGMTTQTANPSLGFGGIAIPTILGTNGQTGQFIADFLRRFNLVDANGNFAIAGNGRLFIFSDSPETQAILVTNQGFASVADLLDSSFFFNQLSVDRGTNFVRLGDGFFETQLISQEIRTATGRVLLPQFADSLEQAKALLQSGVDQQQALNLKVGVALTSDQIANLKSSLAWYVETVVAGKRVLVPVVYLAANDVKSFKEGAIVSAANVVTNITGDLVNAGTIRADKVVSLTAGGNIVNASGSVIAASDLVAKATKDILTTAAAINVTNTAVLSAGRNIDIGGLVSRSTQPILSQGVSGQIATDAFKGSTIVTGTDFYAIAGGNLTIKGSSLASGGDVWLVGAKGINLVAGQTSVASSSSGNIGKASVSNSSLTTSNVLSDVIGAKISISSPERVNITGANVTATGALTISGGSVGLSGVVDVAIVDSYSYTKKCSWFSCKKTTVITNSSVQKAIVTTLEGGEVSVTSLGDIDLSGVNLVSDIGTIVTADGDIKIGTLESYSQESKIVKTKKTGFSLDGLGFFLGSRNSTQVSVNGSQIVTGSLVGTSNGDTDIVAQRDLIITASQVVSSGLTSLAGRSITIQSGTDVETTYSKYVTEQSGLGFKIGSSTLDSLDTLQRLDTAVDRGQSTRVKAIAALAAIVTTKNAYDGIQRAVNDPLASGSATVTLGISKSTFESRSRQETNVQSSISGKNVQIVATEGDVRITGSPVRADDTVQILAPQNVILEAMGQTGTTSTQSSSFSAGIFAKAGASKESGGELSVGVNASGGNGSSIERTVEFVPTTVQAGNRVDISAGNATIIRGARVEAGAIKLTTGSLLVESVQNTAYYDSTDQNYGISISYNFAQYRLNVSANYGRQKLNGDFRSVDQQSGIFAGTGGFNVSVKNDTVLIGGAIYSSAPQASNSFTTGTFSFADIENVEKYAASSLGINVSTSGSLSSPFASPGAGMPSYVFANGKQSSTTQSLLSPANTTITSGDTATELALASVLSDPTVANNPLIKQFTAAKRGDIEAGFEVVNILKEEVGTFLANRAREADDKRNAAEQAETDGKLALAKQLRLEAIETESDWGMGGSYRQILTALAAAAGGNLSSGLGDFVKDTAVNLLQQNAAAYIGDLVKSRKLTEAQADILHALVGCAAQAAGSGSCASGAAGEGGAAVLSQLLKSQSPESLGLTAEEREARSALLQSLVAGLGALSGVDGAHLAGAIVSAQAEFENNSFGMQKRLESQREFLDCESAKCKLIVFAKAMGSTVTETASFTAGFSAGPFEMGFEMGAGTVVGLDNLYMMLSTDFDGTLSRMKSALSSMQTYKDIPQSILDGYKKKIDTIDQFFINGGNDKAYAAGVATFDLAVDIAATVSGVGGAAKLGGKIAGKIGGEFANVGIKLTVAAGKEVEVAALARATEKAAVAAEGTAFGAPRLGLIIPQGMSARMFDAVSGRVRGAVDVLGLGDDIFVMGSRSGGTAAAGADFDFGIRVSSDKFDELIASSFGNPRAGSALSRTRDASIRDGRIQTGEAGLRAVRRDIARTLGVPENDVQISVIKSHGVFDNGPQTPLSFKFKE